MNPKVSDQTDRVEQNSTSPNGRFTAEMNAMWAQPLTAADHVNGDQAATSTTSPTRASGALANDHTPEDGHDPMAPSGPPRAAEEIAKDSKTTRTVFLLGEWMTGRYDCTLAVAPGVNGGRVTDHESWAGCPVCGKGPIATYPDNTGRCMSCGKDAEELWAAALEGGEGRKKGGDRRESTVRVSSIRREQLTYLEGTGKRIPVGKVTIVAGHAGLGKSQYSVMVAARQSHVMPVLMLNAEDGEGDTIRPRLAACGADLDNIHLYRLKTKNGVDAEDILSLPEDAHRLENLVREHGIELITLDPLMAHLDGTVNSSSDKEIRSALNPLMLLGKTDGVTCLVVAHLKKAKEEELIHMVGGSTGIVGIARSALVFARNPEDPAGEDGYERVLVHVKANLGKLRAAEVYRVEETVAEGIETVKLAYQRDSTLSNRVALGGEEGRGGKRAESKPGDKARWGIREMLRRLGPLKGEDIEAVIRAVDIGKNTVQAARAELAKAGEIERFQENGKGEWRWRFAAGGAPSPSPTEEMWARS